MQLGLKHGTTTEIKVWSNAPGLQCDSCRKIGYPKTSALNITLSHRRTPLKFRPANWTKPETIALHVRDQTGFETSVKMLNTVGLRYLMQQYAASALRDVRFCRFLFDGERLVESETPKKVGLSNSRMRVVCEFADWGDRWARSMKTALMFSLNSWEVEQSKSEMWLCLISTASDHQEGGKGNYWLPIFDFEA